MANIRKDTLHKLTTYLAKNHGTVVIKYHYVSGMFRCTTSKANHKLAKSIAEQGFYKSPKQLKYKSQWYGSEPVISR